MKTNGRGLRGSLLLLTALALAACNSGAATQRAPGAGAAVVSRTPTATAADLVYILSAADTPGGGRLKLLHGATGAVARDLLGGTLSPDGTTLFATEPYGGPGRIATTLEAYDVATGALQRKTVVDGDYALPAVQIDGTSGGLSPNGRWLALGSTAHGGFGSLQSGFVVLDTAFARPPQRVDLDGDFRFDALADDGASLFLAELIAPPTAAGPSDYRVRRYDLRRGALDSGVIVDKSGVGVEAMQGDRVAAVATASGEWLYSLYVKGADGPFIHALNLNNAFAVCIDLPRAGPGASAATAAGEIPFAWSLALAPDGATLYAVNAASGQVAVLDRSTLKLRTAQLALTRLHADGPLVWLQRWLEPAKAQAKRLPGGGAALSQDGRTLFALGERGLAMIDTATLTVRSRALTDRTFDGLALSPDGARLYAISAEAGALLQIDAATGTLSAELRLAFYPGRLLRVR